MDIKDVLKITDHTFLKPEAAWPDIMAVIDDAAVFSAASVCIPPSFVKRAAEYSGGRVKICTVIGFPNGYNTPEVKAFETENAVKNGADEIDAVIDIGMVKEGRCDDLLRELKLIRKACQGKVFKVIIETCLLTEDEKIRLCHIVTESGADFIKTSTGFSSGGATAEDVALLRANVGKNVKVKASGGIRTIEAAEKMIEAGASRIGASAIVAEAKKPAASRRE